MDLEFNTMMTSLAQAHSSPHPGGIQHPGGFQGHPMQGAMAVPHSQGQGQPGMPQQMHMGVSGPGGPQVSQAGALMGGMPPGAGPSAHALQHLNPQAQMLQQQQQAAMCKSISLFPLRRWCKEIRVLRSRYQPDVVADGPNADRTSNISRQPSIPHAAAATTTAYESTTSCRCSTSYDSTVI